MRLVKEFLKKVKALPLPAKLAWVMVWFELNPLFQLYKGYRTGHMEDVAPMTFLMIFGIGGVWLWYGVHIKSWPLIMSNALKLVCSALVLGLYTYYFFTQ